MSVMRLPKRHIFRVLMRPLRSERWNQAQPRPFRLCQLLQGTARRGLSSLIPSTPWLSSSGYQLRW